MSQPYKVGFANLSEVEEYAVIVRESLEALTAQDVEIELIVRNNDHDDEKALANAREFAEMGVDLVIMYHINERLGPKFRSILKTIPIVCVDIPIPFTAYVGIDNSQMGAMAAEALLSWVHQGWGSIDKVLAVLDSRVLDVVRDRIMQVTTRLEKEAVIAKGNILFLDARFSPEETYRLAYQALQGWEEFNKIAVVAYNDQTALNALKVVQDLHLEDKVVIVGHAASDIVIEKIKAQTPLIASTLSYPEKYGEILLDVAKHIVRGDRVPPRNYVPLGLLKSPVIA